MAGLRRRIAEKMVVRLRTCRRSHRALEFAARHELPRGEWVSLRQARYRSRPGLRAAPARVPTRDSITPRRTRLSPLLKAAINAGSGYCPRPECRQHLNRPANEAVSFLQSCDQGGNDRRTMSDRLAIAA